MSRSVTRDSILRNLGKSIRTGSLSAVTKHLVKKEFMSDGSLAAVSGSFEKNNSGKIVNKDSHEKIIRGADRLSGEDFKKPVHKEQRLVETVIISAAKHSNDKRRFGNMIILLHEFLEIWVAKNETLKSSVPLLRENINIVKGIIDHVPDANEETQKRIIHLLTFLMEYRYTVRVLYPGTSKFQNKEVHPFVVRSILTQMHTTLPSMARYEAISDFVLRTLINRGVIVVTQSRNNVSIASKNTENITQKFGTTRIANNGRSGQVNLSQQNTPMTEAAQTRQRNYDAEITQLFNDYSRLKFLQSVGHLSINNVKALKHIISRLRAMKNQNISPMTQNTKSRLNFLLKHINRNRGPNNAPREGHPNAWMRQTGVKRTGSLPGPSDSNASSGFVQRGRT